MKKDFSVSGVIKEARAVIQKSFWLIIGQYVLFIISSRILQMILGEGAFLGVLVMGYVAVKWALAYVNKGSFDFDDLFEGLTFKKFMYFVCTFFLIGFFIAWPGFVMMVVGLIIFVIVGIFMHVPLMSHTVIVSFAICIAVLGCVPAVILYFRYIFAAYISIDTNVKPMQALRESKKITAGVRGKLCCLAVVLLLVNVLGALCLLVGLLYTIPLTAFTFVIAYKKLSAQAYPENSEIVEVVVETVEFSEV